MSIKEQCKEAFLKEAKDQGLSDEQILAHVERLLEKQASLAHLINWYHRNMPNIQAQGQSPLNALANRFLASTPVALPLFGGAGLGILASKMRGNYLDEEDVKNQELIDELRRQTALAKQYKRLGQGA